MNKDVLYRHLRKHKTLLAFPQAQFTQFQCPLHFPHQTPFLEILNPLTNYPHSYHLPSLTIAHLSSITITFRRTEYSRFHSLRPNVHALLKLSELPKVQCFSRVTSLLVEWITRTLRWYCRWASPPKTNMCTGNHYKSLTHSLAHSFYIFNSHSLFSLTRSVTRSLTHLHNYASIHSRTYSRTVHNPSLPGWAGPPVRGRRAAVCSCAPPSKSGSCWPSSQRCLWRRLLWHQLTVMRLQR